jgi:hypothetical protein
VNLQGVNVHFLQIQIYYSKAVRTINIILKKMYIMRYFSLQLVEYSPHRKLIQLKVVDLNEIYAI